MFRKVLINEEQKCKRSKCRKSLVVAGVKEDENFHWCAGLWKDSIYMENSKAFPAMGNLLSCFNQWKNSQSAFSLQKILSCLPNLIKFILILSPRRGLSICRIFCLLFNGGKQDRCYISWMLALPNPWEMTTKPLHPHSSRFVFRNFAPFLKNPPSKHRHQHKAFKTALSYFIRRYTSFCISGYVDLIFVSVYFALDSVQTPISYQNQNCSIITFRRHPFYTVLHALMCESEQSDALKAQSGAGMAF